MHLTADDFIFQRSHIAICRVVVVAFDFIADRHAEFFKRTEIHDADRLSKLTSRESHHEAFF